MFLGLVIFNKEIIARVITAVLCFYDLNYTGKNIFIKKVSTLIV